MRKLQTQGVHHITIVGADRQTSIDFWEGVLGMPFVFEQPNLDNAADSHLYFDPGDGRLITIFTNEERVPDPERTPTDPGCVHHLAFAVSQATFNQTIDLALAVPLMAGSVIGAQFGVGYSERFKAEQLRALLALIVVAVAVRMAFGLVIPPADIFNIEDLN